MPTDLIEPRKEDYDCYSSWHLAWMDWHDEKIMREYDRLNSLHLWYAH